MADQHLVSYLAGRDEPCPACNYNLRGLLTDHCPECNRHLVLQVRLAEPRMAAWITALIATCTMLGFNGILSLYFITSVVRRGGSRDMGIAYALFASTFVAAIGLAILLRGRRWFGNLPLGTRVAIAIAAWAATVISSLAFFSLAD